MSNRIDHFTQDFRATVLEVMSSPASDQERVAELVGLFSNAFRQTEAEDERVAVWLWTEFANCQSLVATWQSGTRLDPSMISSDKDSALNDSLLRRTGAQPSSSVSLNTSAKFDGLADEELQAQLSSLGIPQPPLHVR
jgi:hypothetical protein